LLIYEICYILQYIYL